MVKMEVEASLAQANIDVSDEDLNLMVIGITWFMILHNGVTINQALNYLYF
jgi:hypothetical protein